MQALNTAFSMETVEYGKQSVRTTPIIIVGFAVVGEAHVNRPYAQAWLGINSSRNRRPGGQENSQGKRP